MEGRLREALSENRALRTALRELTAQWDTALDAGNKKQSDVKDGIFELPHELCTASLTTELEHKVEALEYYTDQVEDTVADGKLTLTEELVEAKKIIREQQKLLASKVTSLL